MKWSATIEKWTNRTKNKRGKLVWNMYFVREREEKNEMEQVLHRLIDGAKRFCSMF